jgi:hypothetical protein
MLSPQGFQRFPVLWTSGRLAAGDDDGPRDAVDNIHRMRGHTG